MKPRQDAIGAGPGILGLDIGGANLKGVSGGVARTMSFPLWKQPERLAAALAQLAQSLPAATEWRVTMTGELADCFATKAEGVRAILDAACQAAGSCAVQVWCLDAVWLDTTQAAGQPARVAAANWHAQATWLAKTVVDAPALLIDIGSTTCDIVPLAPRTVLSRGRTDTERLACGELVYTGASRTPLCAVLPRVHFGGQTVRVAAELFATTLDAWLLADGCPEDADNRDTADGRPATRDYAAARLARMLCAEVRDLGANGVRDLAGQFVRAQLQQISAAMTEVLARGPGHVGQVVVSGSGAFIAERALELHPELSGARRIDLPDVLGPEMASAACAYALTQLPPGDDQRR